MNFTFDINKKYETPIIALANPDKNKIGTLGNISGLVIKSRFNAVSEVTFEIYEKYFDNIKSENIKQPCYELIKKNKLLYVAGFGWFIISNVEETDEGNIPIKSVTAYSYEYILNSKNANIPAGTYRLYDPVKPEGTLLQKVLEIAPSWGIGYVSSSLFAMHRTFEMPSTTLYSFLMDSVEKAYECIFEFDTEKRLINAYKIEDIVKETDVSLSFRNLLKNVKIEETKDNIVTCLSVHGSGDFDIATVNPIGNANIYNFDYYKTPEWMPQNLIDKINSWETKVKNSSLEYSNLLTSLKEQNLKFITSQNELETFKNNLKAQEQVRSAQMPNVSKTVIDKINELNKSISAKENEISKLNQEIAKIKEKLLKINKDLSFSNNFTKEELLQLDNFIFQGSYTNENFVVTDRMTVLEVQEMAEQLLDQGTKKLKTYSQPTFNFSMDAVNFLFLEKFKPFIDEMKLGSTIHAEISEGNWVSPILLEMSIDYENPENFTMTFGNQFRLQTSQWTFNELFNQSKVTNSVASNFSGIMAPIKSGGLND